MKIVRTIITLVVVLGLLIWGGITLVNNKKKSEEETKIVAQKNESVAVNVAQVKIEDINTDYVANGTFEPYQEMMFPSEISGKITRVLVDEGSYVSVGQCLPIVGGDTQSIDRIAARTAGRNPVAADESYENAMKTGGVTQQQVHPCRLQLKRAKAQLERAKIRVGDTN